ncbi:hypothetical protein AGLY_008335 [Aphis glycines]|uniref:Uncharacterized protein n=1 Tax=Aphis glycines TaxID=307491 RepID=A0A6G0TMT0_APHGL|nr:hypothetical protein AGLY_008335 [Aphis glycines]
MHESLEYNTQLIVYLVPTFLKIIIRLFDIQLLFDFSLSLPVHNSLKLVLLLILHSFIFSVKDFMSLAFEVIITSLSIISVLSFSSSLFSDLTHPIDSSFITTILKLIKRKIHNINLERILLNFELESLLDTVRLLNIIVLLRIREASEINSDPTIFIFNKLTTKDSSISSSIYLANFAANDNSLVCLTFIRHEIAFRTSPILSSSFCSLWLLTTARASRNKLFFSNNIAASLIFFIATKYVDALVTSPTSSNTLLLYLESMNLSTAFSKCFPIKMKSFEQLKRLHANSLIFSLCPLNSTTSEGTFIKLMDSNAVLFTIVRSYMCWMPDNTLNRLIMTTHYIFNIIIHNTIYLSKDSYHYKL